MKSFASARLGVLSAVTVLSLFILGLAADLYGNHGNLDFADVYGNTFKGVVPPGIPIIRVLSKDAAGFAIAISVITLIIAVPLLVFTRLEKRSDWQKFLSLVWVELFWATALWILWLVSAVKVETFNWTSLADSSFIGNGLQCGGSACGEARALKGLAWLAWFIMFGYLAALGACSAISVRRGGGTFTHMDVDQVLSPNDNAPVGPPVVEELKQQA